ncbi:MAG: NAD(P)-dependent oxidoreductase [Pseudomonadota bacterium]|nr:NAD(P)-dependent oxidoreductase [Pseudomonadota bacterium]
MKVFVTGVNSFIGKHLIQLCRDQNVPYGGVDLVPNDDKACSQGDIRDPQLGDLISEGTDALIHLAALSRDDDCRGNLKDCFDINVMGTLNLLEIAKKKNVKQFIFASSEWVYGNTLDHSSKSEETIINPVNLTSEYALSKFVSEISLVASPVPSTVLRFGIVYGPRLGNWSAVEALFSSVANLETITVKSLKTSRKYIHVSDVSDAILATIGLAGSEIINIQGPALIKLEDIIEISSRILGKTPTVVEEERNSPNIRNISGEKATELLGWKPKVSIEDGLLQLDKFLRDSKT